MTLEQIRSARDASPFRPFRLLLDDGREFLIEQQAYLGITPRGVLLAVTSDRTAWLTPAQVKELRPLKMVAS